MTDPASRRLRLKSLAWFLGCLVLSWTGAAHACTCASLSPDQGFTRAEYVFTGTVVEEAGHTWTVAVDKVWKGAGNLAPHVHLLDVYDGIDCAFYFEPGRAYIFFAIVAKSSRYVYYQPEVCNWTRPLRSTRVPGPGGPLWLEDAIVAEHGPGRPAMAQDPWRHLPDDHGAAGG